MKEWYSILTAPIKGMKGNQVCTSPSTYSKMTEALITNISHYFTPMLLIQEFLTRSTVLPTTGFLKLLGVRKKNKTLKDVLFIFGCKG